MSLDKVANDVADEIERLLAWERDLTDDLAATREKRGHLMGALSRIRVAMTTEGRRACDLRMDAALQRLEPKAPLGGPLSDKVDAVMAYCARSSGIVTTTEIQRYLEKHGLANYRQAAATLLARKAKQGCFERIGRGRYRVLSPTGVQNN
ncbi:MAG: hypothetical protein AAF674_12645 [Pseudomonadota bacterium]